MRSRERICKMLLKCPSIKSLPRSLEATYKTVKDYGPYDRLVNNAATDGLQSFLGIEMKSFDRTMQGNTNYPPQISQTVAKGMIERMSGGSIVNISSQASKVPFRDSIAYGPSKAALDQMT